MENKFLKGVETTKTLEVPVTELINLLGEQGEVIECHYCNIPGIEKIEGHYNGVSIKVQVYEFEKQPLNELRPEVKP
jgi:hypothetical protein